MVTPLQLVFMMARVAREDNGVIPHLIKSEDYPQDALLNLPQIPPVKKETFDIVKQGLKKVVSDETGTAHMLDMEDLPIWGKTGTAQVSGGRLPHAWFLGFCPVSTPKIVFCVFLGRPLLHLRSSLSFTYEISRQNRSGDLRSFTLGAFGPLGRFELLNLKFRSPKPGIRTKSLATPDGLVPLHGAATGRIGQSP